MDKRIFLCLVVGFSGIMLALFLPDTSLAFEIDNPLDEDEFIIIVDKLIDFIFTIAVVVTPLMIGVGAFLFAMAGGNAEQINRAKKIILWTIIGFVVVLLARGIIEIVRNIFGI